jgi:predicted O-methyltransferase YrrM
VTEPYRNEITIAGEVRSSDIWGMDFLSELRRILGQYVKPVTRAYLEWGTGTSTLAILDRRDTLALDTFYSIDDQTEYQRDVVRQFPAWNGFHPICASRTGPMLSDRDPELNYATLPLGLASQFDFIFIDGRRRLECAFVASLLCHADSIVVLHDYRRTRYQPVRALYEIVEDGSQFRVMRARRILSATDERGIRPAS